MSKPVRFIAEVSSNHHGSLERSLAFVDSAAHTGCSDVKFQLFRVRDLFSEEALRAKPELLQRESWELNPAFLGPIAERCRARGIGFGCTPFYLDAVAELEPYVDFFKIASYELIWIDLIRACAKTGKPVIISTGMASTAEIQQALSVMREHGCAKPTILHCVSGYPTPIEECNLAAIETMRRAFDCEIGWSDHSVSEAVISRAVHRWGAAAIEFHLDLDGSGDEFRTGHCWLPDQIANVIQSTNSAFVADGDGVKRPARMESVERLWRADPTDGLRPTMIMRQSLRDA